MPDPARSSPERSAPDWKQVVARIRDGDRVAFVTLGRLVTGFLASWRAYDFRDDWDDMLQEVVTAVVLAHAEGRLADADAVAGFVRQTTRFKFVDRLRALRREAPDRDVLELVDGGRGDPWPPGETGQLSAEGQLAVREALSSLPERERSVVVEVYVHGRTYEEAAAETGIPLGTLKRSLREALTLLRVVLADG